MKTLFYTVMVAVMLMAVGLALAGGTMMVNTNTGAITYPTNWLTANDIARQTGLNVVSNWGNHATSHYPQITGRWRIYYSDGNSNYIAIPLGTNNTYLRSSSITSAPTWHALEATVTNIGLANLTNRPVLYGIPMGDGTYYREMTPGEAITNLWESSGLSNRFVLIFDWQAETNALHSWLGLLDASQKVDRVILAGVSNDVAVVKTGKMDIATYDPAGIASQVYFLAQALGLSNTIWGTFATISSQQVDRAIGNAASNLAAAASAASGSNTAWLASLAPSQAVDRAWLEALTPSQQVDRATAIAASNLAASASASAASNVSVRTNAILRDGTVAWSAGDNHGGNPITNFSWLCSKSEAGGGRFMFGQSEYDNVRTNADASSTGSGFFGYVGGLDSPRIYGSYGSAFAGYWWSEINNTIGGGGCWWLGSDQYQDPYDYGHYTATNSWGFMAIGLWGSKIFESGPSAHGSLFIGSTAFMDDDTSPTWGMGGSITNKAIGTFWQGYLSNRTWTAYFSSNAVGSHGQGAVLVTNPYSVVSGDGMTSHGYGSHTAAGGFYHGPTNVMAAIGGATVTGQLAYALSQSITNLFFNSPLTNGALNGYVLTWTNGGYAVMPPPAGGSGTGVNAPGVTPFTLTSATNVAITRLTSTNAYSLVMATNVTLTITTNGWTGAELGRFSLDVSAGAFTLAFDTTVMTNTTVLDISTTKVTPLYFRKPVGENIWRVRQ